MATEDRFSLSPSRLRDGFLERRLSYLFVLPAILLLTLVLWLPFFRGVWISLHDWPLTGQPSWVGLDNFQYFFYRWDPFWRIIGVTVAQVLMVFPQVLIGLVVSLALYHTKKLTSVLTSIYLLPYIIPPLASGTILRFFFDPDIGPFLNGLVELGVLDKTIYWASHGDAALSAVLAMTVWTFWPWVLLILVGSRAAIDDDLYETAKVYGANRWQMFRQITLPQLKGALLVVLALRTIYNLTNTAQVWQLTRGGPGYKTTPLGLLIFRFAFTDANMGLAMTAGLILVLVGLVLAIGFIIQFERRTATVEEVM